VHILIGKYTVQLIQLKPSKQNLNNVLNNSTFIGYITIELEKEPNCFFFLERMSLCTVYICYLSVRYKDI